jgi:hypothetical protein
MNCWKCNEEHNIFGGPVRQVPLTGRAAKHRLCCKHDRILFGPYSEEEKGEKQKQIDQRKAWYRQALVP